MNYADVILANKRDIILPVMGVDIIQVSTKLL